MLGLLLLIFLLSACGGRAQLLDEEAAEVYYYQPIAPAPTSMRLMTRLNIETAPLEPGAGMYAGIYLRQDRTVAGIDNFEEHVNVSHAIFAYSMTIGEPYPIMFVLESIARHKTPLITVRPPAYNPYNLDNIAALARDVGRFNVPIFILLYPIEGEHGLIPHEYISFFRESRAIFNHYAPNATMVWGVDRDNLFTAMHFFAGADYVDWVNFTIYNDISPSGLFRDFFAYIDFFNLSFQRYAPMMVTTGVSHHNFYTNTYFVNEAASKLLYIYNGLSLYPRISAIIYQNYDNICIEGGIGQNYTVNGSFILEEAYRAAMHGGGFLPQVLEGRGRGSLLLHSPFRALSYGGNFFIPHRALEYSLGLDLESILHLGVIWEYEIYYDMRHVYDILGLDFYIDGLMGALVLTNDN